MERIGLRAGRYYVLYDTGKQRARIMLTENNAPEVMCQTEEFATRIVSLLAKDDAEKAALEKDNSVD